MNNLNDIFFAPAANQDLTYDQVLEDVQRYFAENHASTIAEAGEGNAERATTLLKELMVQYIVKRKYAIEGLTTEELCEKLYEDMAGYSFLKKWIYKPAGAVSRSRTSFPPRSTPLMWCAVCSMPAAWSLTTPCPVWWAFWTKTSVSLWIRRPL